MIYSKLAKMQIAPLCRDFSFIYGNVLGERVNMYNVSSERNSLNRACVPARLFVSEVQLGQRYFGIGSKIYIISPPILLRCYTNLCG